MDRLLNKLKTTRKMGLIVSLPWDSYDLAKKVWEAGADAIKVHINVYHGASQHQFGSLEDNRAEFEKILKESPVPVGIVPGQNTMVCEQQIDNVVAMGFDFISLYCHHMPASLVARHDISKFFSVDPSYSLEEIKMIAQSPLSDMLEMGFTTNESPENRLNARDIQWYREICSVAKCPTILPTQHMVYPSDVKLLHEIGVSAIMIGAIVTTNDVDKIVEKTKEFRKAIDELC
jgi:hypothetical protein